MTDLTEQWNKGKLPVGEYYLLYKDSTTDREYYDWANVYGRVTEKGFSTDPNDIDKVLASVPTYEEYLEMEGHCAAYSDINQWQKEEISAYKRLVAELKQENTKLKELLKEVLRHELSLKEISELTRKICQALGEDK